jgi:hypothetical protein
VTDLKFGPLPKKSTVKVTIELPEPLEEELDAYATEHSKLYGPVETKATAHDAGAPPCGSRLAHWPRADAAGANRSTSSVPK